MTPLLRPLACKPHSDSFSTSVTDVSLKRRLSSRAMLEPTTPPPITKKSALIIQATLSTALCPCSTYSPAIAVRDTCPCTARHRYEYTLQFALLPRADSAVAVRGCRCHR